MSNFYVYILKCRDNSFYIGYTTDLYKRILTHNLKKGAKYTRGRTPVLLVYYDEFEEKSSALKSELLLKKLSKRNKTKYIYEHLTIEKNNIIKKINEDIEFKIKEEVCYI